MRKLTTLIVLLALGVGLVSVASADTVQAPWDGTTVSETFSIDNSTDSLGVTAENLTDDSSIANGDAEVVAYGIEDGNETMAETAWLSTDATNTTDSWSYSDVGQYDEYRVEVSGEGADHLEIFDSTGSDGAAGYVGDETAFRGVTYEQAGIGVLVAGLLLSCVAYIRAGHN